MFEIVIIALAIILIIGASIFSWRMDNVENVDKDETKKVEDKA